MVKYRQVHGMFLLTILLQASVSVKACMSYPDFIDRKKSTLKLIVRMVSTRKKNIGDTKDAP